MDIIQFGGQEGSAKEATLSYNVKDEQQRQANLSRREEDSEECSAIGNNKCKGPGRRKVAMPKEHSEGESGKR